MRVKLEDEVTVEKKMRVSVRPALIVPKCDGCGKIFYMKKWNPNDESLGELHGTFDVGGMDIVDPRTGKGMGNIFLATVCSFKCAHELFASGGWRKMENYKPFADADVPLVRAALRITSLVVDEKKVREEWMEIDESTEAQASGRWLVLGR
jgi:hypothetical protein